MIFESFLHCFMITEDLHTELFILYKLWKHHNVFKFMAARYQCRVYWQVYVAFIEPDHFVSAHLSEKKNIFIERSEKGPFFSSKAILTSQAMALFRE